MLSSRRRSARCPTSKAEWSTIERGDDLDLLYGLALAHNRAIVEFCATDRRLLPVGYLPLGDIDRSIRAAAQAIELGVAALMIASHPLRAHAQSHIGFDPIWARAQDAGVPIVSHVGGEEPMFRKNEDRLKQLSLLPSEFVRRQVRVTPYPHEPAGWIVQNSAPEIMMFSSDYPHVEGGRHPMRRFEASLAGCTAAEQHAFYCDNFVDLIGPRLAALSGS